jgi:acetylornithine deacetylase
MKPVPDLVPQGPQPAPPEKTAHPTIEELRRLTQGADQLESDILTQLGRTASDIIHDQGTTLVRFGPPVDGGVLITCHWPISHNTPQKTGGDGRAGAMGRGSDFQIHGNHIHGNRIAGWRAALAAILQHSAQINANNMVRPLWLALGPDTVADQIAQSDRLHMLGYRPDLTLCVAETGMRMIQEHPGQNNYVTRFFGHAGQSAKPWTSVNAAELAARYVDRLLSLRAKLMLRGDGGLRSTLSVLNVTSNGATTGANTGTQPIPDRAAVSWALHPVCATDVGFVLGELETFSRSELEPQMQAISPTTAITFDTHHALPPLQAPLPSIVENWAARGILKTRPTVRSMISSAGLWTGLGAPVLACGPKTQIQENGATRSISLRQIFAYQKLLERVETQLHASRP